MMHLLFIVTIITSLVPGQAAQWWEGYSYEPTKLTLSTGIFTGKRINVWGFEVEIYRGKIL